MARRVIVVGAGFAGTAAAYGARRAGAEVRVIHGAPGASALFSGALDLDTKPSHQVQAFAEGLGCWSIGSRFVATSAGVIRRTQGSDKALLDLGELRGTRVAVLDAGRDDWEANTLSRSFSETEWARRTGTVFERVPIGLLKRSAEQRIPSYDFAKLHDDSERLAWAAQKLIAGVSGYAGCLTGPWLGVETCAAGDLTARLGCSIGETTSLPGGPAAARFELARARLFSKLGVREVLGHAARIEKRASVWALDTSAGAFEADAVVLAIGGVAGGGVRLKSAISVNPGVFELSLEAAASVVLDGDDAGYAAAQRGFDFAARGLSALERVGIACSETQVRGAPGLFAAGDAVAGEPRLALAAVDQGMSAGRLAASV